MSEEMDDSLSTNGRGKRRKIEKKNASAFEKLRASKQGGVNKWAPEESSKIYDEVDEEEYSKLVSSRAGNWIVDDDGEGYVEDGREIFDDAEEDYELQSSDSNKRKSHQNKRGSKLPDEPVAKKKSLKNFFATKESKEKEGTSVEDDNLLKNILGELNTSSNNKEDSKSNSIITPKPMKSIRKQANESEIEVKKYMEKFGKKAQEKKDFKADNILEDLLKEERKSKGRKDDENVKISSNVQVKKEISISLQPSTNVDQEDQEMLEASLMDEDDDFPIEQLNDLEKSKESKHVQKSEIKIELIKVKSPPVIKTITAKPVDSESTIFNELQGIDFDAEIKEVDENIDWSTETMKFYYLDAWADANNRPGEVYLFGKIEVPGGNNQQTTYNSICVRIENVDRTLFLLPRSHVYNLRTKSETDKEVTISDVYEEFEGRILEELKLSSFKSRKVFKSFAFTVPGVDVPIESEYLEVSYAGKYQAPNPKNNYSTIAHIFGSNTSPIETLLLERKIKGPCWLDIKNFKVTEAQSSWTKKQISCPDMNCVSVSIADGQQHNPPPPLVVATINVKCILNSNNNRNEIVQISCLVHDKFQLDKPNTQLVTRQFCGLSRPSNKSWPFDLPASLGKFKKFKIFKFDNERALLSWFLSIYQNIDPDLVVTFDSNDCQLDIICNRITFLKIPMWSRIGRLKINQIPGKRVQEFFIGRMICDVKLSATELIKSRSYDLGALCQKVLKIKEDERQEIIYDNIPFAYDNSTSIIDFIEINVQDCIYISKLMVELNIIPLALQITNIAGNLMSRTLQGGRSERNEFLLMHAFHEKQYIVPDKKMIKDKDATEHDDQQQGTKKKAAYTGGLVLDPIKGFYESFVLLMDFNSLYPSIIQEYNICYTTIAQPNDPNELPSPPDPNEELGILPRQIRRLVESRRNVKLLMAKSNLSSELKMQYNIRQMALKLTANSMYGCLGFSKSRFYAPHLAALVTCKGREILMATKTLVERLNHNVIYGDTDSIMINTNSQDFDEVYKIGANIKKAVNSTYKHVELDIDGVYQKLLLLKKKKYAAVAVTQKQPGKLEYCHEYKGLDIVRRDWSKIASSTGTGVLEILLSNNGKEMEERVENIFEVLVELRNDFEEGKVPLPMLVITKQLTKAPSEYADMSSLPHVQVADRMNVQRNRRFKKGDMIDYIICDDGTENPSVKRGYHIDEIKSSLSASDDKPDDDESKNKKKILKPDKFYYLSQQIHPVICRLLEPIEGIDSAVIAEKLGLDPKDFRAKVKVTRSEQENDTDQMIKSNEKKFRDCEKFMFPCASCKSINFVAAPFKRDSSSKVVSVFDKCINNECKVKPLDYLPSIKNHLRASITKAIQRFYENWFICDNPMCNNSTQNFAWPIDGSSNLMCLTCMEGNLQRIYTNQELNMQLDYYNFMFNIRSMETIEALHLEPDIFAAYDTMLTTTEEFIHRSKFFTIEFRNKFNDYDFKPKATETSINKLSWKQFFVETYAD
ncbi:CLUMA_CG000643, isoform A [Clunio marinus]|uniref:DNA polymerase n=1 Tax=Clunio marinus TaxID=568069 RepID=A0A1J1HHB6_9DIPT|nr:CLUMA_CG000643, isoform A [Clunio marinus]